MAPGGHPDPACILPPRLDGGTRCYRDFSPDDMPSIVARVLQMVREPRSREQEAIDRASGGFTTLLPTPPTDVYRQSPRARVYISGERRQNVSFLIPDVVYIQFSLDSGRSRLEWKARVLHDDPHSQRDALEHWISAVNWMATGQPCALEDAHDLGWRFAGLEICADFVGVEWIRKYVGCWVTPSGPKPKQGEWVRRRTWGPDVFEAETIEIGRRVTSNVSWCLYHKTAQLEEVKAGDVSCYSKIWKLHGWREGDVVARAEVRLRKRALHLVDADTGETLNLQDPAVVADPATIRKVWAYLTQKFRLVDLDSATRARRCKTRPEWEVIQAAACCEAPAYLQDRPVTPDSWRAAVRRARRGLIRYAEQVAALHDLEVSGRYGYAQLASFAEWDSLDDPVFRQAMETYGDTYSELRRTFMGRDIEAFGHQRIQDFEQAIGHPMRGVVQRPPIEHESFWWEPFPEDARAANQREPPTDDKD